MNVIIILAIYLVIINIIGFVMMGVDKGRARKRAWRIPEAHLFIVALIGGSVGSILGMQLFRHKTRHWYFVWGMPAILIIQIILIAVLCFSPVKVTIF